ncbi:MAG TPA: tail fiber domain-containing protein [Candidatus Udaeobacter sp.]|nr:tail fiber domain-containing protein [Candidatus Udaeobacter sp.]
MKKSNVMRERMTVTVLIIIGLACFGPLPLAQAVSPAPDGGYPGFNTAEGQNALNGLTTGIWNTGLGAYALWRDTDGSYNTAVGTAALLLNVGDQTTQTGLYNTAVGVAALILNTAGSRNTAVGLRGLLNNDSTGNGFGNSNSAFGADALFSNTDGGNNTAVGDSALFSNQTGGGNVAVGSSALHNDTGDGNTAVGVNALFPNTTGVANTAVGGAALGNMTSGSHNIALGTQAGSGHTIGDGNVYIGMPGQAAETSKTYIANINTTTEVDDPVYVDTVTGLLGHLSSSRRYKEDIRPMDSASETIYRLKPVTYRYKKEFVRAQSPAFGLIAEEVAEVNPALVARNAKGQPESVHYEMVNAMLLNEFLKEHKKVEDQQAMIGDLKSTVANQEKRFTQQEAQIEALRSGLQKVSAQLEISKPVPQVVLNNR